MTNPFHFQFYSHANIAHGNIVRATQRTKNAAKTAPTFSHSLSNSSPSANFYPNESSSISNFATVNNINYPNCSNSSIGTNIKHQFKGLNAVDNAGIVTGIDCNIGGMQDNINCGNSSAINQMTNNPFLAKYSHHHHHQQQPHHHQPPNTLKCDHKQPSPSDKKFNSLKSIGMKKSPHFYSMRLNKCKRHQTFSNEPQKLLLVNNANQNSMSYISQHQHQLSSLHPQKQYSISENATTSRGISSTAATQHHQQQSKQPISLSKLKNYNQPLYENLTDSIQIHESSTQNENSFASVLDEFNCEMERNSIYRSDSGISNSSYECITPVPAPRTNPKKYHSAPVYVNLPNTSMNHYNKGRFGGDGDNSRGKYSFRGKSGCRFLKLPSKCKSNANGNFIHSSPISDALHSYEVCHSYSFFSPPLSLSVVSLSALPTPKKR